MGDFGTRAIRSIGQGVVAAILSGLLVGGGTDRQAALRVGKLIISRPDTADPIVGHGRDRIIADVADGSPLLRDGCAVRVVVACRIRAALRVLSHIRIGIHAHHVVLEQISLREAATERIIVARPVIIQSRYGVIVLTRETFGGVGTAAATVARSAIRSIQLAGEQTGAAGRVAEDAQQRAEAVAEEEIGGLRATTDLQFTEQATGQGRGVGAAL